MATRPVVDDLIGWLKLNTSPSDATLAVYTESMETALAFIESRINLPDGTTDDDYPQSIRTAELLTAARFAKRSTSPEGVAGFGDLGVVHIMRMDPDVEALISRYKKLDGFY